MDSYFHSMSSNILEKEVQFKLCIIDTSRLFMIISDELVHTLKYQKDFFIMVRENTPGFHKNAPVPPVKNFELQLLYFCIILNVIAKIRVFLPT